MAIANIHASCVICAGAGTAFGAPADAGVLLLGDSGSYKSDLALRLMAMGARLVSDDRCDILFDGATLRVRAPPTTAGLIEVRGLGLIVLPFVPEARVALVVRALEGHPPRLPALLHYRPPADVELPEELSPPEIAVAAPEASAPVKILAAVAAFEKRLFREELAT